MPYFLYFKEVCEKNDDEGSTREVGVAETVYFCLLTNKTFKIKHSNIRKIFYIYNIINKVIRDDIIC